MDALKKANKKRAVVRTAISKLFTKVDSLLNKDMNERENLELGESLQQLSCYNDSLNSLNEEIDVLITDETAYDNEIKTCFEYCEKFTSYKFKITNCLDKYAKQTSKHDKVDDSTSDSFSMPVKNALQLPKLNIDKFNGESNNWLEFYNSFDNAINSNSSLSKIEKFVYLKSLLCDQAYSCVSGFSLTDENYESCLQLLQERFGRKEILITTHMNKLLNLEPVKHISNIKSLRKLYDEIEICVRNLNSLNVTSGSYGNLLIPLILKLLPEELNLEFHRNHKSKEFEVTDLIDFLKHEIECRETVLLINSKCTMNPEPVHKFNVNPNKNFRTKNSFKSTHALNTMTKQYCIFCMSNDHKSFYCVNTPDIQKRQILKKQGRCYRCYQISHLISDCKSKIPPCETCNSSQHSKLFCNQKSKSENFEKGKSKTPETPKISNNDIQTVSATSQCNSVKINQNVVLKTCCAIAESKTKSKRIRILLDSGSEKNFILKSLAKELKLPLIRKEKLSLFSFGSKTPTQQNFEVYNVQLKSRFDPDASLEIEVFATEVITQANIKSPTRKQMFQRGINNEWQISDCLDYESPISLLIGAESYYRVHSKPVNIQKIDDELYAVSTIFGFAFMGKLNGLSDKDSNEVCSFFASTEKENFDLSSFWKLDSLGIVDNESERFSKKDTDTIENFNDHLKYLNGRYETKLLFEADKLELNSNFETAERRFDILKDKLNKDEETCHEYLNIIEEQERNGIVEEVKDENFDSGYFMPHRPVIRPDKETTRVRIVFDASSKGKNSKSLNELLLPGPNLNPNLLDIILKFRKYEIAFSADIEKAFLMISIAEEDRKFLKFLWFQNNDPDSFKIMHMNRLPFGVNSSPFILAATIKNHIKKYSESNPACYEMLDSSLYVDDLFHGASQDEEAFNLTYEATEILKHAGMNLRKFKTNSPVLRKLWKENGKISVENSDKTSKILGIFWDTYEDKIFLDLKSASEMLKSNITKRHVLQTVAKLYDPVGFISPFVMRIKCLLQEMWQQGIDWDEKLPDNLSKSFLQWYSEINKLQDLTIFRRYFQHDVNFENIELKVFSDASLKGYGAVAYFHDPVSHSTSFVMAKSRVAPLKKISLPRLELLGAVVAARMTRYLKTLFKIPNNNITCFSDSQIVLYWIKGSADKWKPFIANRVREIQDIVDPCAWKHCRGSDNPADVLSRGCTAADLKGNTLWWNGPNLTIEDMSSEQETEFLEQETIQERRKAVVCIVTDDKPEPEVISKFSSWIKLNRVIAWILRFNHNCKFPSEKITGFLTCKELNDAADVIVKVVQNSEFKEEIRNLKKENSLSPANKIANLNPFLDTKGLLRVGGRLRNANLPDDEKHQLIMPKNHYVTELIIKHYHGKYLHSGIQLTISSIRQKFWIINIRAVVRRIIWKCIKCFRNRAKLATQIMGDLPPARVIPNRIFSHVGLDFGGPFMVKTRKGRGIKPFKIYVCLYICMSTKAVHLEIVSDLSSEAFLASLKRFVARRGKPQELFSDRGTNFVGADKELRRAIAQAINDDRFHAYIAEENIKWNFNPPSAPHFGGLWEAGIKSMKYHLRRTVGSQILTYEEFLTLLTQVESCLNSRPITPVSTDPEDLIALTPGHFLIGAPLTSVPESDLTSQKMSLQKRWKLTQQIFQHFWKRWSREYLCQLQQRGKWRKSMPNISVNDLVLIKDEDLPPLKWKLGRIMQIFPGLDSKVRVVKIKTVKGELLRPITKLCLLPISKDD